MRKEPFVNDQYYHIYNRGVDKRRVFLDHSDYARFLLYMNLLNDKKSGMMATWKNLKETETRAKLSKVSELSSGKPLVEIICFCLNPNHFHFILKQSIDKGVGNFMHKISTGYTNYFNKKNNRSGSLFQGPFKSIRIKTNEKLLYLSAYVNCNSEIHGIHKALDYKWCSFSGYIGKREDYLCNKSIILGQFKNKGGYEQFAKSGATEMKIKKEAEKDKLFLE